MGLTVRFALSLAVTTSIPLACSAAPDEAAKQRCPKPVAFAIVFSLGYAADKMPQDDARFEQLLEQIKDASFNTIHCTYSKKRLSLCKKHGIKMMIDLLAEECHVFKSPDKAQALCEKLRNDPTVWGYNIWNDNFAKTAAGRQRDVDAVRKWDLTHPAYCGTYRTTGMKDLANPDVMGYYDFHWKRGLGQHFPHLLAYGNWARERDAWFYSWLSVTSGQPGKGNFNRCLYSANTSIACGLKGILWFLGTDLLKPGTQEWTAIGGDVSKVNKEILPLSKELVKIGNATVIYSTAVTRTPNDKPLERKETAGLPDGLQNNAFPKEGWIQPVAGEFVLGVFQDVQKRDLIFVANHNAYAPQSVALRLAGVVRVSLFNRKVGEWQPLEVQDTVVRFQSNPAGGELLRLER